MSKNNRPSVSQDSSDEQHALAAESVPTPQPAEYAEFDPAGCTKADARKWLADLKGRAQMPEGHDLSSIARSMAEAQALAGEEFDPLIKEPLGMVSEQRRWYDIVRERAEAK